MIHCHSVMSKEPGVDEPSNLFGDQQSISVSAKRDLGWRRAGCTERAGGTGQHNEVSTAKMERGDIVVVAIGGRVEDVEKAAMERETEGLAASGADFIGELESTPGQSLEN